MLILTRRPGESIMIESSDAAGQEDLNNTDDSVSLGIGNALITVTVLRVKGGQISLGINAPPSIAIFREEIYRKKEKQNGNVVQDQDSGYESDDSDEDSYY